MTDERETVVKDLLGKLRLGSKLMKDLDKVLDEKYLIDGKTMTVWREYFHIKLERDLTPESLGIINAKLNDAINEAGFWHARALLLEESLKSGAEAKFDDSFRALVASYASKATGKLPANATLKTMAEQGLGSARTAMSTARARTRFWKSIVEMLDSQRKIIEQQRWIMYTDVKIAQEMG